VRWLEDVKKELRKEKDSKTATDVTGQINWSSVMREAKAVRWP
jgi:hypothetical protein